MNKNMGLSGSFRADTVACVDMQRVILKKKKLALRSSHTCELKVPKVQHRSDHLQQAADLFAAEAHLPAGREDVRELVGVRDPAD